ncbi:hypothetical protein J6Z19_01980 [bacterium]|nr:hypothetical protein [bacterium]
MKFAFYAVLTAFLMIFSLGDFDYSLLFRQISIVAGAYDPPPSPPGDPNPAPPPPPDPFRKA